MTTTFDIDALPTIPSSWTAPTSCFASTLYYRVLLESGSYFSNLYGTPTPVLDGNVPSGDCFPPSFTVNVPYRTTGDCPAGYTRACATAGPNRSGRMMSTVTCCPSVTSNAFSFMCRDHEYGCHGTGTAGATWTGVVTNIGIPTPTEEPVTREPFTVEGIEAWGIKFISVAPTTAPTSATPSAPSTSPQPPAEADTTTISTAPASPTTSLESDGGDASSGGLSPGAIAGVVIGSTAVAIGVLVLAGFLAYRWKRKPWRNSQNNDDSLSSSNNNNNNNEDNNNNEKGSSPNDGSNHGKGHGEDHVGPGERRAWELQG